MKIIKIIGWVLFPYIMIPIEWEKIGVRAKIYGSLWSAFLLVRIVMSIINNQSQTIPVSAPPPVTASTSTSTSTKKDTTIPARKTQPETPQTKPVAKSKPDPKISLAEKENAEAKSEFAQLMSYPKLGHSHEVGSFNITVNNINRFKYLDSYNVANGMYWAISVTIRNGGSSPQTIDDSMFQIISPIIKGKINSYSPDSTAEIYANTTGELDFSTLNPGVSQTGFLVFDMPAKYTAQQMKVFHLYVTTGRFGLGAKQSFSFLS